MPMQIIILTSLVIISSVFATITWLFFDALKIRIEIKSLLKGVGSLILTVAFTLLTIDQLSSRVKIGPNLIFYLQALGFWLIFSAFTFDAHAKLRLLWILAIISLFLLRDYTLLATQSLMIAIVCLSIAKLTKHNDLIPFGVAFVQISAAEFFFKLEEGGGLKGIGSAGYFLYIFASILLFLWLWSYLVIRFNINKSLRVKGRI